MILFIKYINVCHWQVDNAISSIPLDLEYVFVLNLALPSPVVNVPYQSRDLVKIYDMVRVDGVIQLKPEDLDLEEKLGAGNFGSVMKGSYKHRSGRLIPVAVKVLKTSDMPTAEVLIRPFVTHLFVTTFAHKQEAEHLSNTSVNLRLCFLHFFFRLFIRR